NVRPGPALVRRFHQPRLTFRGDRIPCHGRNHLPLPLPLSLSLFYTRREDSEEEVEEDSHGPIIPRLASFAVPGMERYLRHTSHVDADYWQDPTGSCALDESFLACDALRHRPRPNEFADPLWPPSI